MILRPYQLRLIDAARVALRKYQSIVIQAPTGAGKTAITVNMMSRAKDRGLSCIFCVHQKELLKQTSRALWEQKLEHGMIAAGKKVSKMQCQVASVQTLVRRLDKYPPPDLLIIDEAHRAAAATYLKVIAHYPKARVIGLTATPQRTDGKGLENLFDTIVRGPSVGQLIDAGYLSNFEIYAPPNNLDVSEIKKTMGDYDKEQLEALVDTPSITGDAVEHYIQHTSNKRCVVMCVTVKHAQHVAAQYQAAGISAEAIWGDMENAKRDGCLARFKLGQTRVITNVQLLIEGIDIPSIEVIQWLRPTESLIIWMQGNGRGLRVIEGKEKLTVLDHVGNFKRHGLPDEERYWTLKGKTKRKKDDDDDEIIDVQQCQNCFTVFRRGVSTCPKCGHSVTLLAPKEILVMEGQLEKIDLQREQMELRQEKREQRQMKGRARTVEDLIKLGIRRGISRPAQWAVFTVFGRENKKPTGDDFHEATKLMKKIKEESQGVIYEQAN